MSGTMWLNGILCNPQEARVSALDHGFTVGDGVFETLRVDAGVPFALTRHLVRLQYSLDRVGIGGVDLHTVRDGVKSLLGVSSQDVTRLRITVTSGVGPQGLRRGPGPATVLITASHLSAPTQCRVVRTAYRRNERSAISGVKSMSYGENAIIAAEAAAKGADEAVLANSQGHLCEGITTNVFIERGGEILTPPLASGCLAGITRGLALEWGARAGLPVRVAAPGEMTLTMLDEVAEGRAFMAVTSSARRVQNVAWLDGVPLGAGPLLTRLGEVFVARAAVEVDPAPPRPTQAV